MTTACLAGDDVPGLDLASFLRHQSAAYGRALPARVERLAGVVALVAAGCGDRAAAEREAHAIAGSAGTFGFAAVGDAARALEIALAAGAVAELPGLSTRLQRATARR